MVTVDQATFQIRYSFFPQYNHIQVILKQMEPLSKEESFEDTPVLKILGQDIEDGSEQMFSVTKTRQRISRNSCKRAKQNNSDRSANVRMGHWDQAENFKYFTFLQVHHINFERKNLRRSQKIFKIMSRFLGTRTADQCRSHHQKMQKKCLTFQNILQYLSRNFKQLSPNVQKHYSTFRKEAISRVQRTYTFSTLQTPREAEEQILNDPEQEKEMPECLLPCYELSFTNETDEELRILKFNSRNHHMG